MLRLLLGLCIAAGCALCGHSLTGSARRRAQLLEELTRGLKLLKLHMTSMFEAVPHALSMSNSRLLEGIGAAMGPGISAAEAWGAVLRKERRTGGLCDALLAEDIAVLDRLFAGLGESGRDAQELLLSEAAAALSESARSARERAEEAERLYTPLGLLAGLMLALVVV